MEKFLNVNTGNYTIKVQDEGTITLDTGNELGSVIVTGDLVVRGDSTTVDSENLSIRDNVIVLNKDETGSGITLSESGLLIDRGSHPDGDATFKFKELISYTDYETGQPRLGAFSLETDTNNSQPALVLNKILTDNKDLYLIGSGSGVISVTGTTDYENQVTDDDHIPNKAYVDNFIDTYLTNNPPDLIAEGTTSVETIDSEIGDAPSRIVFSVNGDVKGQISETRAELGSFIFSSNEIESTDSNSDIIITPNGVGNLSVRSGIVYEDQNSTLSNNTADSLVYNSTNGVINLGGSQMFVVNSNNDAKRETYKELTTAHKAFVMSLIF